MPPIWKIKNKPFWFVGTLHVLKKEDYPISDTLQEAIDIAIVTPGSDSGEIADAQQSLADGDTLRADEQFKDAVNKYKDALGKNGA